VVCAGLSTGESTLGGLDIKTACDDIKATAACLRELGTANPVFECGESGTTLRFLMPVAMARGDEAVFRGEGRLLQRPLGPFLEALAAHGVSAEPANDTLTLHGRLRPGRFSLPGNVSSQFVSGLLLALPLLEEDSEILLRSPLQSEPYVNLTLEMMARFGVTAERTPAGCAIPGMQKYLPAAIEIEGDWSAAAFFLAAGALGRPCKITGLAEDSAQGDRAILDILRRAGVIIEKSADGGLTAQPSRPRGVTVDMGDIPDLAPPLAALFALGEGTSRLTNAGRLRHKESDRLRAIAEGLRALGGNAKVDGDALVITGKPVLAGGTLNPRGDHRIAMMGAVAACGAIGEVFIENAECVAKSYPGFWEDFCRE